MIVLYDQNIWNHLPANRNRLVRDLVTKFDADFCTFQECGPDTNRVGPEPMYDLMSDVYEEICKDKSDISYTAVFYKKDKYHVLDSGFHIYTGMNDCNSKTVTWGVFEDKDSKKVAVISTHFWWMDEKKEDEEQRIQNAVELQQICRNILSKYNIPILIGGDLNNGKGTSLGDLPYRTMLQKGFVDIRLTADETTDSYTALDNCYPVLNENGVFVPNGSVPCVTIDYIFTYGAEIKAKKFDVITTPEAMSSSDHCPLVAYFEF